VKAHQRFISVALGALLFVVCVSAEAQQHGKVPRIGILISGSATNLQKSIDVFRHGLRELGHFEGTNILIEARYADGNFKRLPDLAAELVRLKPDVIVTQGTRATLTVKEATNTIPIVVTGAGDLVGDGIVASLARPGGNVTGSTNIDPDLSAKRLELLKETFPKLSRVGVLYQGGPGGDHDELKETHTAARVLGVQVHASQVHEPSEFESAYAAMTRERVNALIIFHGTFTLFHGKKLLELANKNHLATMCGQPAWAEIGGLITYGHDRTHQWRRAAYFVDRILKGTAPAHLPIEQPTKFELIINLKTAKQIGVTIPQSVLYRGQGD
jgi:putative ABC transport system substrate-binding protein